MVSFNTKARDIWVRGDNKIFDASELAELTKKERASLAFKIRPFTPKLSREIRESVEGIDLDLSPMSAYANRAWQEDVLDKIVLAWKNVSDENGKPLECSQKNKLRLFDLGYPRLGICIVEAASKAISRYEKLDVEAQEKRIKNSSTSQGGQEEEKGT